MVWRSLGVGLALVAAVAIGCGSVASKNDAGASGQGGAAGAGGEAGRTGLGGAASGGMTGSSGGAGGSGSPDGGLSAGVYDVSLWDQSLFGT